MPTRKILNIGSFANDGTGDTLRDAADKINHNFSHLYNNFNVQSIGAPENIDENSGVVIITNSGFSVNLVDGTEIGELKYIVNQSGGSVDLVGSVLGGSQITLAGTSACQIIWTGLAWAVISDNGISIT